MSMFHSRERLNAAGYREPTDAQSLRALSICATGVIAAAAVVVWVLRPAAVDDTTSALAVPAVVVDAKLPPGTAGTAMAPSAVPLAPLPLMMPPKSPHYWTMDEAGSASP